VLLANNDLSFLPKSPKILVAEWTSSMLSPSAADGEPKACFVYDVDVHDVRVTAKMKYTRLNDNRTENTQDLFTSYQHTRDHFVLKLHDVDQYQVKWNTTVHDDWARLECHQTKSLCLRMLRLCFIFGIIQHAPF